MATRYAGLRSAMSCLKTEFERAAERSTGLFHDLLFTPRQLPATTAAWDNFIVRSRAEPSGSWERWEVFPCLTMCSRFHGAAVQLDLFFRLAATGRGLLEELRRLPGLVEPLPRGFKAQISTTYSGVYGWLLQIHSMAASCPTAFLTSEMGIYGEPGCSLLTVP